MLKGAVASYWKDTDAVLLGFPAASMQLPLRDADAVSGPLYVCGAVHEPSPLRLSVMLVVPTTAWLYQPAESATRSRVMLATGAVASYLNDREATLLAFPATSVQLPVSDPDAVSGPL